jgi:DNA polymerase-1
VRRWVLIDVANCLYRAFFAPFPPLRTSDGTPTKAVYVFGTMLRKLLREQQPDAIAMVMDPPGGGFRREIFPAYKATRDAQPEELSQQIPLARELAAAWRIPMIEVPGYEADDVIATLTRQAPDDVEVVIVSTDKDLMQLVGGRVTLLDTMKDRRIGPAEVEARFGVPPAQLLDVRALVGDSSDNIPGVKGIGEKGAAELVREWGSLERLLENAESVKAKKAREALLGQADEARLSKQLATLHSDVPLPIPPAELARVEPDRAALAQLYRRLEFTRLLEELEKEGAAQPAAAVAAPPLALDVAADAAALARAVAGLSKAERLALVLVGDPEEGGLVPDPAGVAIAGDGVSAVYVPIGGASLLSAAGLPFGEVAEALRPLLAGPRARPWLARNTKRVQTLFAEHDAPLPLPAFDVDLAAFLIDPAFQRGMPALANAWLGRSHRAFEEVVGRGAKAVPAGELPVEGVSRWAAEEASVLLDLAPRLAERLRADELAPLFEDVELPLTAVLSAMEREGVRVDEAKLAELSREYERELVTRKGRIEALAGEPFQVNSPKQLGQILFEKLKLPVVKKTKTGYSTDESVLEQLSAHHELPAAVLAWRRLAKLKSTYVDALPPLVDPKSGRIHPTFHQTGAATGRLSSSNPNVQNIPIRTPEGVRIREAFVPSEGQRLLSADYSQVELRIVAHYSGDESLIEAFERDEDVHRRTAAEVHGIAPEAVSADQRAHAKAINFGIIYGSSAFGIANQLGIAQAEAQATIDRYFERYRGVRRFLDESVEQARTQGFVRTLLGRRRYLPDLSSRNRALRQAAERMAVNTVIQGTAADLIKKAMVEVAEALREAGLAARMILQVHDELVFEAPERELEALSGLVRERMQSVYALRVPLRVDVGTGNNWREAH